MKNKGAKKVEITIPIELSYTLSLFASLREEFRKIDERASTMINRLEWPGEIPPVPTWVLEFNLPDSIVLDYNDKDEVRIELTYAFTRSATFELKRDESSIHRWKCVKFLLAEIKWEEKRKFEVDLDQLIKGVVSAKLCNAEPAPNEH